MLIRLRGCEDARDWTLVWLLVNTRVLAGTEYTLGGPLVWAASSITLGDMWGGIVELDLNKQSETDVKTVIGFRKGIRLYKLESRIVTFESKWHKVFGESV